MFSIFQWFVNISFTLVFYFHVNSWGVSQETRKARYTEYCRVHNEWLEYQFKRNLRIKAGS